MVDDKYIGLALAVSSSLAIGTSFIITKKGLNDAGRNSAYGSQASDNLAYLRNPIWWAGISTLVLGEIANFAAYTFAPPILVTPLGALSVLIGAVLASFLLNEELGHLGRVGCALCLLGSLIIVLHAPEDKPVETVDEILHYAIQPGFLMYCLTVLVFALVMIYSVAPKHGRSNPIVYISICSLVGSVSVMAIKGFGVAVKLTFAGKNQFTHPSTYVFGIVVAVCIIVQMNYFNKALDTFSTNVVNPMYYVGFSTCTIVASLILFQGFNTTDASNTFSLLAGFIVTFLGVHLLNLSRTPPPPLLPNEHHSTLEHGLMNPRLSLQGRMSLDGWNGVAGAEAPAARAGRHGRQSSLYRQQSSTLFSAFGDEEEHGVESVGLQRLREDSEEDDDDSDERTLLNSNTKGKGRANGGASGSVSPHTSRTPVNGVLNGTGHRNGGSRSHSHSPLHNAPPGSARVSPRPQ
ncbi:magnesium transporter NIPA-domain-containing protein [Crucibulum laeve]|uniref:Magnesium transporter NIPA-domain-containing protein n=1 Tax=Crucibulum laeve TaxID=68775 RepID=A0A5C3M7J0_9AGAR|nr:magnesium transporter NIPA-domain-containing protein [Crucibulum laeve]